MKNIIKLVELISRDNHIPMKPVGDIGVPPPLLYEVDWLDVDQVAGALSPEVTKLICSGDHIPRILGDGLEDLSYAIGEIMDSEGDLWKHFFSDEI